MRFVNQLISVAVFLCFAIPAGSQMDPLAPDYLYGSPDPRYAGSEGRYDPLSIDPLLRSLDPEYTLEYLEWLRARGYYPSMED